MHIALHLLSLLAVFLAGYLWDSHSLPSSLGALNPSPGYFAQSNATVLETTGQVKMPGTDMDAIMLLGDSLTQGGWEPNGFAQRLAYRYARRLDIINRGLSGYNAAWGLEVFRQVFPTAQQQRERRQKTKLLVIWFGANDACLPPKVQHSPLEQFVGNMKTLLSLVRDSGSTYFSPHTRLLLVTPPPFSSLQRGSILASRTPPEPLDRDQATTKAYAEAVTRLGGEEGVPVVDMYSLLWGEEGDGKGNWGEEGMARWMDDGLHINAAAYGILYEEILKKIEECYPELYPDNLPFVFAPWDEMIRTTNPQETLRSRYKDI